MNYQNKHAAQVPHRKIKEPVLYDRTSLLIATFTALMAGIVLGYLLTLPADKNNDLVAKSAPPTPRVVLHVAPGTIKMTKTVTSSVPVIPPSLLATSPNTTGGSTKATYIVVPGDTLQSIATFFHIKNVQKFYQVNKKVIGPSWDSIQPGDVLVLTVGE